MRSIVLSFCFLFLTSCGSESTGLTSSAVALDSMYARLTIKDGLVVQSRQVIVDIQFRENDVAGETIRFDQGERLYADGTELAHYEDANGDDYYAAWIGLDDDAMSVEFKFVDGDGRETVRTVALAEKATVTNFADGDTAPELADGIALQYAPASMDAQANFNVGGGECQTHFDHENDGSGGFAFTEASIESAPEAALWVSGEKIYIRLQNVETLAQPVAPFGRGEIVAKGYTNLELVVP